MILSKLNGLTNVNDKGNKIRSSPYTCLSTARSCTEADQKIPVAAMGGGHWYGTLVHPCVMGGQPAVTNSLLFSSSLQPNNRLAPERWSLWAMMVSCRPESGTVVAVVAMDREPHGLSESEFSSAILGLLRS